MAADVGRFSRVPDTHVALTPTRGSAHVASPTRCWSRTFTENGGTACGVVYVARIGRQSLVPLQSPAPRKFATSDWGSAVVSTWIWSVVGEGLASFATRFAVAATPNGLPDEKANDIGWRAGCGDSPNGFAVSHFAVKPAPVDVPAGVFAFRMHRSRLGGRA